MKVLLTNSAADYEFRQIWRLPHIGLLTLYSALPESMKQKVHYLDSDMVGENHITQWIRREKPDIVAISALSYSYKSAISIGKVAKNSGAIVIIGGIHATHAYCNIQAKVDRKERPFDFVVPGHAAAIFRDMLIEFESKGKITKTPLSEAFFPSLDYSLLKGESAVNNYKIRIRTGNLSNKTYNMSLYTQVGCPHACKFCSVNAPYQELARKTIEESLRNLLFQTPAEVLHITSPNFTERIRHVEQIAQVFEKVMAETGKNLIAYAFVRADAVNKRTIHALKRMNALSLLMGYENGSNYVLSKIPKSETVEQMLSATKTLADNGIEVLAGTFDLGTPPETRKTLEETIGFVHKLNDIGNVRTLLVSPNFPTPGSVYWTEYLDVMKNVWPDLYSQISRSDLCDVNYHARLFRELAYLMPDGAKKQESPTFEEVLRTQQEMLKIIPEGIMFSKV